MDWGRYPHSAFLSHSFIDKYRRYEICSTREIKSTRLALFSLIAIVPAKSVFIIPFSWVLDQLVTGGEERARPSHLFLTEQMLTIPSKC